MKVRAVFQNDRDFGFDGSGRRRNGDEFSIDENKFDPSWMEKVEEPKVVEGSSDKKERLTTSRKAAKAV